MPEVNFDRTFAQTVLGQSAVATPEEIGEEVTQVDAAGMARASRPRAFAELTKQSPPRYEKKPNHGPLGFDDFQIGSTRLSVPPTSISVERLRDVQVTPLLRGQSVASKASANVVRIHFTVDIPQPELLDSDLRPIIAELKTCPFTKLASYDLAVKLLNLDHLDVDEEIRDAQENLVRFNTAADRLTSLIYRYVTWRDGDAISGLPEQPWQLELYTDLQRRIQEVAQKPNVDSYTAANDAFQSLTNIIRSNLARIDGVFGPKTADTIGAEWGVRGESQGKYDNGVKAFRDRQDRFRKLFGDLVTAAKKQIEINNRVKQGKFKLPPIDPFIPVACQQVFLTSDPDNAGAFKVRFTFELFFHDNYVPEMKYHTKRPGSTTWSETKDPAEADLLLRWRDKQYLDGPSVWNALDTRDPTTAVRYLNSDRNGVPGFMYLMQESRRERRCASFSPDPAAHGLRIFYPRNIPQIPKGINAVNSGAHYQVLDLDTTDADSEAIVRHVQVTWNLNIARQVDEHNGIVRHQYTGGSSLQVSYELCVPQDDAEAGDEGHARVIGSINQMFSTMERNRKLLPSDGFVPTTVFVRNPVTALFGAYCFELLDMPMLQDSPGEIKTSLNMIESIPVIGLSGSSDLIEDAERTKRKDGFSAKDSLNLAAVVAARPEGKFARDVLLESLVEACRNLVAKSEYRVSYTTWTAEFKISFKDVVADISFNLFQGERLEGVFDFLATDTAKLLYEYVLNNRVGYGLLRTVDAFEKKLQSMVANRKANILDRLSEVADLLNSDGSRDMFGTKMSRAYKATLEGGASSPDPLEYVKERMREAGVLNISENADVLQATVARINFDEDGANRVLTEQLYPDMTLPTYAEVLDVDPSNTQIPDEILLKFMPSMREVGLLNYNERGDDSPSRKLTDLADPDVYFVRYPSIQDEAIARGVKKVSGPAPRSDDTLELSPEHRTTAGDDKRDITLQVQTERSARLGSSGEGDIRPDKSALEWNNMEQYLEPNSRRMLFAFPTFSMEFFLDITHAKMFSDRNVVEPGTEARFEGRFINVLPMADIEVYEDKYDRPNFANLTFIARRAGLRNESWRLLPPKHPLTVRNARSFDGVQFTNNPKLVINHLKKYSTYDSDPMLLTSKLLATGSRCVLKIGYGTDINNSRMMPTKIAGTIAEIALGEVSQMVVQSFGTQLINPMNTTIGGFGRWTPGRVLTGLYTLRAFSDIFHSLDMRFMGRTGRGIDVDIAAIPDEELERIAVISYNTSTLAGRLAQSAFSAATSDSIFAAGLRLTSRLVTGLLMDKVIEDNKEFLEDVKDTLDPFSRFYPEFLNVLGPTSAISDWAISNSDTKNLPATVWIDLISKLNPGTVWWPHTYGDEVRLFWGRPESVFKAEPSQLPPDVSNFMVNAVRRLVMSSAANLEDKIRTEVERNRNYHRIKLADGSISNSTNAALIYELINPRDTRDFTTMLNMLSSEYGLDNQAVGELVRQLCIQKFDQIYAGMLIAAEAVTQQNRRNLSQESIEYLEEIKRQAISDNTVGIIVPSKFGGSPFNSLLGAHTPNGRVVTVANIESNAYKSNTLVRMKTEMRDNFADRYLDGQTFLQGAKNITSAEWSDFTESFLNNDIPWNKTYSSSSAGSFGITELQILKFVIERVTVDLNYMFKDPAGSDYVFNANVTGVARALGRDSKLATKVLRINGYRRFRNSHFLMSGQKLLSSHVDATQAYMANAVAVDDYVVGYNVLPEERRVVDLNQELNKLNFGIFEWFKGLASKNDRDRVIEVLLPAALARGMSKMYQGEITLTGDPWIKPHDTVFLLDLHNGVYGPVEACTVINKLSPHTGLVTIVRPCALTQSRSTTLLSDYVVRQRQMKLIATTAVLLAIPLAFFPPIGTAAAVGLALGGAVVAGASDIIDVYARLQLQNIPATDAFVNLAQSEDASQESIRQLVDNLMYETYVPSNSLKISGMGRDVNAIMDNISRQRQQTNREMRQAQLGVTMIPLKRLATHAPIVAGLRSSGFETISVPGFFDALTEGQDRLTRYTIERTVSDLKQIIDDQITDLSNGWAILQALVKTRAEEVRRIKSALRERGLEVPE